MADATYQPKIYKNNNGDRQVIVSGGELRVETGGKITPNAGTQPTVAALTDNSGGTSGGNTVAAVTDAATAANAIATLTAKVNALQSALAGVGIVAAS